MRPYKPIRAVAALALMLPAAPEFGRAETFQNVSVRQYKGDKDRRLVERGADLIFDDAARRFILKSKEQPLDVPYDEITKVIFEVTEHMRGMNKKGIFGTLAGGAIVGAVVGGGRVKDHLCYLEHTKGGGSPQPYVIEVARDSIDQVKAKMTTAFSGRVQIIDPLEGEKIEKETLKDLASKHDVKVVKDGPAFRPPAIKPDKALVLVVSPTPSARFAGKGNQVKLHANDRVVAVNKQGTYAFAYLDPGVYVLVAQAENASGLRMNLEAGKDYYLLQNILMGAWKGRAILSRHSKEYVLFEASGAYLSDWQRKDP